MSSTPSILLLGSTGRLGVQIIHQAASNNVQLHALARSPSKLTTAEKQRCTSIIQGDPLMTSNVSNALSETGATVVVVAIGSGKSLAKTDVRETSARVLVDALKAGGPFEHVKVVAVSAVGAGGTKLKIGFGVGKILQWMLKNPLADHTRQETMLKVLQDRLVIVRPVGLGDGPGGRQVVEFKKKPKNGVIDRADVAKWIVERVKEGPFSGEFNITKE